VRLAAPPRRAVVAGDRAALRRLLVNVLDNAVRYAATSVTVSLDLDTISLGTVLPDAPSPGTGRDHVVLAVADDGPGIPPADLERVFGRFTRLDDARTRADGDTEGAGLGLAIVRATAQAHGGQAWLENTAPGLRAIVQLPEYAGPE
jgi:signal transduction histidine kinase